MSRHEELYKIGHRCKRYTSKKLPCPFGRELLGGQAEMDRPPRKQYEIHTKVLPGDPAAEPRQALGVPKYAIMTEVLSQPAVITRLEEVARAVGVRAPKDIGEGRKWSGVSTKLQDLVLRKDAVREEPVQDGRNLMLPSDKLPYPPDEMRSNAVRVAEAQTLQAMQQVVASRVQSRQGAGEAAQERANVGTRRIPMDVDEQSQSAAKYAAVAAAAMAVSIAAHSRVRPRGQLRQMRPGIPAARAGGGGYWKNAAAAILGLQGIGPIIR